jgi:hypothetical protein
MKNGQPLVRDVALAIDTVVENRTGDWMKSVVLLAASQACAVSSPGRWGFERNGDIKAA